MKRETGKTNGQINNLMKAACGAGLKAVESTLASSLWLVRWDAQEAAVFRAEDVTEELGFATRLAYRPNEQGVWPPDSLALARNRKPLQPRRDLSDARRGFTGGLSAKNAATAHFLQLIAGGAGKDHVTQDRAISVLANKEEPRPWFEGFLKHLKREDVSCYR